MTFSSLNVLFEGDFLPPLFTTQNIQFVSFILTVWCLRVILLKTLVAIGRSHYAELYRLTRRPVINDKQLERESIWKYGYFYDTLLMLTLYILGMFRDLPLFTSTGFLWELLFHATVVEFVYYWWHRVLHVEWFYKTMHSYHHKSINTEPTTALSFEIAERLSYSVIFAIAPIATYLVGAQSLITIGAYLLWFDFSNEGGHINFEVLPDWLLNSSYKWLFYSPSFHSIHHTKFKKNFSLFMPWTDLLFGTANYKSSPSPSSSSSSPSSSAPTSSSETILPIHGGLDHAKSQTPVE